MKTPKVAVIGSSCLDLYLIGLDRWPEHQSERARIQEIKYFPGGNGLNVAINLARLGGLDVTLYTAIGHGPDADLLTRACRYWDPLEQPPRELENPIHLQLVTVPNNIQTTLSIVRLDANNEPSYLYCPGACKYITKEFLSKHNSQFDHIDLLYLAGLGTLPNLEFTDLMSFVSKVREGNPDIRVIADVNLLSSSFAQDYGIATKIMALLAVVDYFIPNEAEAIQYSGSKDLSLAAKTFNHVVRAGTVVKCGQKGVLFFDCSTEGAEAIPAFNTNQVLGVKIKDAVGAGDAWGAGFAASILYGSSITDACVFGNAVAAHCICDYGGVSNSLPYASIAEWIEKNESSRINKTATPSLAGTAPQVFVSYCHKDSEWKDRLLTQLGVLVQNGMVATWDDQCIRIGDDWRPQIEKAIRNAEVAILLVSAHFLASKFIMEVEVPELLSRRAEGTLNIFPIIVTPCNWQQVDWLSKMQCHPADGEALSGRDKHKIEVELATVTRMISELLTNQIQPMTT